MESLKTFTDYTAAVSDRRFSSVFIKEPASPEVQEKRGNLFILLDISPDLYALGKTITHTFETEYYHKHVNDDSLAGLEKSLSFVNQKIKGFFQIQKKPPKKCNIVAAVFHKNVLHLVQLGDVFVFLFRKGSFKRIENVKSADQEFPQFLNIATGTLLEGDTLLLSDKTLLDRIELKKLKQIVAVNYPTSAIARIKEQLAPKTSGDIPNVAITEFTAEGSELSGEKSSIQEEEKKLAPQEHTKHSISQKSSQQGEKETIIESLKPAAVVEEKFELEESSPEKKPLSDLGELGKWKQEQESTISQEIKKLEETLEEKIKKAKSLNEDESTISQPQDISTTSPEETLASLSSKKKASSLPSLQIDYSVFDRIKNTGKWLFSSLEQLWKQGEQFVEKAKDSSNKIPPRQVIYDRTDQYLSGKLKPVKKLRKRYWFLVLGLITTVFLVITLFNAFKQQQEKDKIKILQTNAEKFYKSSLETLKINDIPTSRKYLSNAVKYVDKVLNLEEDNEKAIKLKENIQDRLDQIDGIVRVKNPQPLADLQTIDKNIKNPNTLLRLDQTLYILDPSTEKILSYSLLNNKLQELLKLPKQAESVLSVDIIEDAIYLYSQNDNVNAFDTQTERLRAVTVSFGGTWKNAEKIYAYNNKLYFLDLPQDQIWRYQPNADSFAPATRYFENTVVSLTGTVDLGIDGDVYILKNDGQLTRYTQIRKPDTTFSVANVTPPLEKPSALFVVEGQNNHIFIADPPNKRIVEINKVGHFQQQYVFDGNEITSITDIVVDNAKDALYFLSGTKIYKIDLVK